MNDEWSGIGLRTLWLAHDAFVLDTVHCWCRLGGLMVYQRGQAERVADGRDRLRYLEDMVRQRRDRQGAVCDHEA